LDGLAPSPGRAVVRALVLGDRSGLSTDLREAFSDAGLGHLLAISGLHLALIGGAAGGLARAIVARAPRLLEAWGAERVAAVGAAVAGLGFARFVGAPPSASRAAALLVFFALGCVLRRARSPLSGLSTGVIVLWAFVPTWHHHIGFALSVSAVFALQIDGRGAPSSSGWRAGIAASARVAVVASLATAPWLIHAFGRASLIGPLANVVAVPWASFVVLPAALAGGAAAFASPAFGAAVLGVAVRTADGLAAFAEAVAAIPGSAITLGAHAAAPTAVAGVGLAASVRRRRVGPFAGALGVALAWGTLSTPGPSVTFLPVGHGDAALVRTGGGRFLLADTGTADAFDRVVTTALRRAGATSIDRVVVSHADADHAGGLEAARARFDVKRVITAETMPAGPRSVDDAHLRFLGPTARLRREGSENDRSLVFRLRLGACDVLFAGDVEAAGERALVGRHGRSLRADVLKVPHHGSETSSTWELLAHVHPRLAVVSVGPNPHGLPRRAALDRIRRSGARLLRTDREGAVHLACDGPGPPTPRTVLD